MVFFLSKKLKYYLEDKLTLRIAAIVARKGNAYVGSARSISSMRRESHTPFGCNMVLT